MTPEELFDDAVKAAQAYPGEVVTRTYIARKLKLGFDMADRVVALLKKRGIVTEKNTYSPAGLIAYEAKKVLENFKQDPPANVGNLGAPSIPPDIDPSETVEDTKLGPLHIGIKMGGYTDENSKLMDRSELNTRIAGLQDRVKTLEREGAEMAAYQCPEAYAGAGGHMGCRSIDARERAIKDLKDSLVREAVSVAELLSVIASTVLEVKPTGDGPLARIVARFKGIRERVLSDPTYSLHVSKAVTDQLLAEIKDLQGWKTHHEELLSKAEEAFKHQKELLRLANNSNADLQAKVNAWPSTRREAELEQEIVHLKTQLAAMSDDGQGLERELPGADEESE